jgi:hypothetical protein
MRIKMKRKSLFILLACVLATVLIVPSIVLAGPPDHAKDKIPWYTSPEEELITVLNPLGIRPGYEVHSLTPRPGTLDGKTVYIICVGFCSPLHTLLTAELQELYPNTNWVPVNKYGVYFEDDPDLWAEIKDAGAMAILHTGH